MGLFRGVMKWNSKIYSSIFLVMFFASATLAAANSLSFQSDIIAQTTYPTDDMPIKTSAGINSECFTGYFTNFRTVTTALKGKEMPVGSLNECLKETVGIALHKDGDKIIWSLAPSLGRFSLNPTDNIKNLQVLLQYSFWF